jgi:hypothetical protein
VAFCHRNSLDFLDADYDAVRHKNFPKMFLGFNFGGLQ